MLKIKQPTKHTGRALKEKIVEEISQKLLESKALVLTNYQGMTHKQIESVKKALKAFDSSFSVTKNSLLKIALEKSEFKGKIADLDQVLQNPTAALFIKGDPMESLKKLAKAMKDFGLPKVKVGVIDGNLLDEASIIKLASLPSKEVLIAQLANMLNSPIARFTFVLNANLQKLVVVLNEVSKTRPPATEAAGNVGQEKPASAESSGEAKPAETVQAPAQEADPVAPAEAPTEQTENQDSVKGQNP